MIGCQWSRYAWANDPTWKYAWVADQKYIVGSTWIGQKGGAVMTVPSGNTFPTFALNGGSRNYGTLTGNGTTDLLNCNALAAIANAFGEFTIMVAYQLLGTIASFMQLCNFSNTSDTTDLEVFQTSNITSPTSHPMRVGVVPHTGTGSNATFGASSNNAWHVMSMAFHRGPSNNYYVQSATLDGQNTIIANSGTTNYSTQTVTLSRFNLFGFWGASKILCNARVRAVLAGPSNMSLGDNSANDSQLAASADLYQQVLT